MTNSIQEKIVKLRINASGKRIIGFVDLFAKDAGTTHPRISDILNNVEPFLLIREAEDSAGEERGFQAIPKDSLSYVEALDEPENPAWLCKAGDRRRITVELREPSATVKGDILVPTGSKLSEVLNDSRRFINVLSAEFVDSVERYRYLAVNKSHVVALKA
ncbi:MAG TPA: hypothetical protein VEK15_18830 [Vicinamibacteria bacterium]|nr:hypothetical protein [Vicinamibacteria bacterium]